MRKMNNEEAVSGVIIMFFIALVFIGFLFMVMGGVMQGVSAVHFNVTSTGGVPLSQDRQDTMGILQGAFGVTPIFAFLILIISAIIAAMAAKYQVL